MTHSIVQIRGTGEIAAKTCAFNDRKHGRCMMLPERILAVPLDLKTKRHMGLCAQHRESFKKDQPAEYKRRLDLSILQWRNYCIDTYGALPACACVGCQVVS